MGLSTLSIVPGFFPPFSPCIYKERWEKFRRGKEKKKVIGTAV